MELSLILHRFFLLLLLLKLNLAKTGVNSTAKSTEILSTVNLTKNSMTKPRTIPKGVSEITLNLESSLNIKNTSPKPETRYRASDEDYSNEIDATLESIKSIKKQQPQGFQKAVAESNKRKQYVNTLSYRRDAVQDFVKRRRYSRLPSNHKLTPIDIDPDVDTIFIRRPNSAKYKEPGASDRFFYYEPPIYSSLYDSSEEVFDTLRPPHWNKKRPKRPKSRPKKPRPPTSHSPMKPSYIPPQPKPSYGPPNPTYVPPPPGHHNHSDPKFFGEAGGDIFGDYESPWMNGWDGPPHVGHGHDEEHYPPVHQVTHHVPEVHHEVQYVPVQPKFTWRDVISLKKVKLLKIIVKILIGKIIIKVLALLALMAVGPKEIKHKICGHHYHPPPEEPPPDEMMTNGNRHRLLNGTRKSGQSSDNIIFKTKNPVKTGKKEEECADIWCELRVNIVKPFLERWHESISLLSHIFSVGPTELTEIRKVPQQPENDEYEIVLEELE